MSFSVTETPPEIQAKLKDMLLSGVNSGNEFWVIMPPNDKEAGAAEMAIYIASGNNPNTRIVVERIGHGEIFRATIPGAFT